MNFLRRRLFVAYGFLLVFVGGFVGNEIGEKLFPSKHPNNSLDAGITSQSSIAVIIAHVLLVAFLIVLHVRRAHKVILDQRPRQWLMFTYGAYAIGIALGIGMAFALR